MADYTPRPHASGRSDDATITADQSSAFPSRQQHRRSGPDYSLLSDGDGDLTGSTPRPPATKTLAAADLTTALPCGTMVLSKPKFADLQTPYEVLKRELKSEADMPDGSPSAEDEEEEDMEVLSQRHTSRLPRMSMTPRGSLAGGEELGYEDDEDVTQGGTCGAQKTKDRLLHRVLDKNYRLLATPHKGIATGVSPLKWKVTAKDDGDGKGKGKEMERPAWQDSPMSSPEMAVPQLRSAAFLSPVRAAYRTNKIAAAEAAGKAPRTPGVSVQTPAGGKKMKDVYQPYKPAAAAEGSRKYLEEISWESDSDEEALRGMSPPKTIQFALLPAKLMQTPGMSIRPLLSWSRWCFEGVDWLQRARQANALWTIYC